jgi:YfiH family protein
LTQPEVTLLPERLESALLQRAGFRHAFFGRRGGVSSGAYASLNFAYSVGDDEANVRENFARAARALGIDVAELAYVSQVHGSQALHVSRTDDLAALRTVEADAVITRSSGLAVAVRTADCVPLLLADPESGAVAAVHAGWRGVVQQIVGIAVAQLGAPPERVLAAVGPHISLPAFEVSSEVAEELARASRGENVVSWEYGPRPRVDLRRIVRAQLVEAGLSPAHVDDVSGCTYGEPERFFSFRRDGKVSGRLLSAIVAR